MIPYPFQVSYLIVNDFMDENGHDNEPKTGDNKEEDDEVFVAKSKSKLNPFTEFKTTLKNTRNGIL